MKRRSEDNVILQLVSCTFLHLQSAISIPNQIQGSNHDERGDREGGLTRSLLAVFGSMTFRMSCTSWARERPTCPCLITKLFGVLSEVPGTVLTCVRFFRLRPISEDKGKPGPTSSSFFDHSAHYQNEQFCRSTNQEYPWGREDLPKLEAGIYIYSQRGWGT